MSRVLVFGTFDGLHPGHEAFIQQARELGDELVVLVAPNEVVEQLKQHKPKFDLADRLASLQALSQVTRALPGDTDLGSYATVTELEPDIIAFGYDQQALAQDFKRFQQATGDDTPTIVLKPYRETEFKSSLLNV